MLQLPDGTDFDAARRPPRTSSATPRPHDETGVWDGGPDVLAAIGATLTPELQYVALDADDGPGPDQRQRRPTSTQAVLRRRDGDGRDRRRAARGSRRHGTPLVGGDLRRRLHLLGARDGAGRRRRPGAGATSSLARGRRGQPGRPASRCRSSPTGHVARWCMAFENADQARTNADTRARLAAGPAPGQGGELRRPVLGAPGHRRGRSDVVLDLVPAEGAYVLSDLSTGPLLFATC